MTGLPLLSLIVLLPWAGAVFLALLPRLGPAASRAIGLVFSLSTLVLGLLALGSFDRSAGGYQFVEMHPWISSLGVNYHLGMDGMSLLFVLLTGIVGPAGLIASWRQPDARLFVLIYLFLQGSALGVFLALDFVPWFLFWELSLFPVFFLIKLWGGGGASRAAYQFVIYTIAGSAFMLLGFVAIYAATGSLDFEQLSSIAAGGGLHSKLAAVGGLWPRAVFLGVFLGLAVKVPLFPFHTWLPSAYSEAPTGGSIFLTGVMSKMGVYGFFRILWPLFPEQIHAAATPLLWMALGGAVLGAFAAMRQTDLKRMVAYSSINHVSYCLLALFAVAASAAPRSEVASSAFVGALLQAFNHGLTASALFLAIGVLEARSGGKRGIDDFGGVRACAPVFALLCGVATFSSVGLPGLNGFVGEFLIFRGVFGLVPWAGSVACFGLLATAIFLLGFWQRVFHGPATEGVRSIFATSSDVAKIDLTPLSILAALMLLFGVFPQILISLFNPLTTAWVGHLTHR